MSETLTQHMNHKLTLLFRGKEDPFVLCRELAADAAILVQKQYNEALSDFLLRLEQGYRHSVSKPVETAIENVFLYSFGDTVLSAPRRSELLENLPVRLKRVLYNQVARSGI